MKTPLFRLLSAVLLGLGLITTQPVRADESSLPAEPQAQSPATRSVQADVDKRASETADEQRGKIIAAASAAIGATKKALQALESDDPETALRSLETATGKLELILARDPGLGLAPVDVTVTTHDLLASPDTVKAMIHDAEHYLEDGEIQQARALMANLASEVVFQTTSIPLATYPDAIKAIVPLIDAGKIDEARAGLQAALNTLVVTTDEVIPLPVLRAEQLLENAEALAENDSRTKSDSATLSGLLTEARGQLRMAELLGYGTKQSFRPMYEQLDMIEEKVAGGGSGKGWFDRIRQQVSELF
jgi:hypothetical protein